MKHHANVAIFVPHQGCPHDCSFCNQRSISGEQRAPAPREVERLLAQARESLGERTQQAQIAFFGGSFTAIEPGYRRALLKAAQPFLGPGGFSGIRVSTRPDAVNEEVLEELASYRVQAVELGAQSMENRVLAANGRRHTAEQTERASVLIRQKGFSLGHQMMTGLYEDSPEGAVRTAQRLIALRPDTMRIYPTLVLEGTLLARLYRAGRYTPPALEEAVALCAGLLETMEKAGVRVIRLGLHHTAGLEGQVLAGPMHPAFRELCEGRLLLARARKEIGAKGLKGKAVRLWVHTSCVSKMAGQRRQNLEALAGEGVRAKIAQDNHIPPMQVVAEEIETERGGSLASSLTGNTGV